MRPLPCPHCHSRATTALAQRTSLGYRQFRCLDCRRQSNERTGTPFNRLQVPTDVALLAVRWYLRYKLSLRNLAEMLIDRGFTVCYETIRGWVHHFIQFNASKLRKHRSEKNRLKWHVDETFVKLNGKWCYLWRAIDGDGNLVDVRLSEHRDQAAAEAFLEQAKNTVASAPDRVVTDGWKGYPSATHQHLGNDVKHECTKGGAIWRYANNRLEQDHRGIKGRLRVMNGLKGKVSSSAERLITGIEEVRYHFRARLTFREKLSASDRRKRYAANLRQWEAIVRRAA